MMADDNMGQIVEDHRFPCPVCGADLRFDPGSGALQCAHCSHQEAPMAPPRGWALEELDLKAAFARRLDEGDYEITRTATCESCGASIEFDPKDHASECAYCASPIIIDTGTNRHLKPGGVIPFALDERQAREALGKWLGRLWFAPNGLSKFARKGRRLNGVYIPFWTYDADTKTQYRGKRGDIYYVTIGHGKNRRREMRIRWRRASGRVSRFFDDVLILASKAMPRRYTDALAPWDMASLVPYSPEFIAGFRAEAYTVSLDEGWEEAQARMRQIIIRDIKFDIGGDRQVIDDMKTSASDLSFKHILLPIYTLAYKFRGKSYRCVINGQTGRVAGERPYSAWKIFFAVLAVAILLLVLFMLSQNMQTGGSFDFDFYRGY